jgi:DNA end-binding protein Ku
MPYSFKGSISFGLVYIPITLHTAVRNNDIGFNMLDKNTMSRVQYKKTCVDCNDKEVRNEDIIKGYQYEENKYVVFEDDDFEKLKTKKDKNITIEQFVDLSDIDPIFFEKSYYVVPSGAERAFVLLREAMESQNKVGIAKTVLGTKETLFAIRVRDREMLLSTMYFHD